MRWDVWHDVASCDHPGIIHMKFGQNLMIQFQRRIYLSKIVDARMEDGQWAITLRTVSSGEVIKDFQQCKIASSYKFPTSLGLVYPT